MEDRRRRVKNLIIFNIEEPEAADMSSSDFPREEQRRIENILTDIVPQGLIIDCVRRIGRRSPNKKRPVCVLLRSDDTVLNVLKNKNKYVGPAKISRSN